MVTREIGRLRLMNQKVTEEQLTSPHAVIQHLGAMQAQDYKQALWGIGARIPAAAVQDVEAAVEAGTILRTWAMRGTIHFILAEDTRWMLELCASRTLAGSGRRLRQLDLTDKTIAESEAILSKTLQGRKALSRAHLMSVLEDNGISTDGARSYHILWQLGHRGVIAIGPTIENEQTFVLLDEWAPQMRDLSREEALTELVTRYFASHAPATEQDFARWSGLTLTDTRRGIANARLLATDINGTTYFQHEAAFIPTQTATPVVKLLAGYDEFLLGYKDRDAVLPPEHADRVVPGNNGVFQPIVVVDGEVVGTWKRNIKPKTIDITFDPFTTFDGLEDAIHAEAEKFGQFWGLPVRSRVS